VALVGVLWFLTGRDGDDEAETATDDTSTTFETVTTTAPLASAAGKPCVAATNTPPAEGKPTVSVPEGPPPTELVIEDLTVGEGEAVPAGATVTVHYVGVSCSTGEQFDASWDRGEPATFSLDSVIPGWTEGIVGMQPGGQRQLVIPPDLAYGSAGRPGIAPDETLIFVVDLVSIGDATATTVAPAAP
jgi:peptidylprolyl isomerase